MKAQIEKMRAVAESLNQVADAIENKEIKKYDVIASVGACIPRIDSIIDGIKIEMP